MITKFLYEKDKINEKKQNKILIKRKGSELFIKI